tara:strand:+ start:438 stop:749 length:312 start_codon:yes stop_codon:yes gene_type:complete
MRFKDIKFKKTTTPKGIQALIEFGPYELSVIQNEASYGGQMGLYEIGVFSGEELIELPGITEDGDCVKGYLTESNVDAIMQKMYLITAKNPVNIQVRNMETSQ